MYTPCIAYNAATCVRGDIYIVGMAEMQSSHCVGNRDVYE